MLKNAAIGLIVVAMVVGASLFTHQGVQAVSSTSTWLSEIVLPAADASTAKAETLRFDADRADCPGQVTCPLTGELVCQDRCPLTTAAENVESDVPACCLKP